MVAHTPISPDSSDRRPLVGKGLQLRHALAGRAVFTVQWGTAHLAFQVRAADNRRCWFVDALVGSQRQPVFIGTIHRRDRWFSASSKRHPTDSQHTRCFAWWWRRIHQDRDLPLKLVVWSSGRCARCGRLLTDPDSIARGIGPVCWAHCKAIVDVRPHMEALAEAMDTAGWESPAWAGCPESLRSIPAHLMSALLRLLAMGEAAQTCQVIELLLGGGIGNDKAAREIAALAGLLALHVAGTPQERKQLATDLAEIAPPRLSGWWLPDDLGGRIGL